MIRNIRPISEKTVAIELSNGLTVRIIEYQDDAVSIHVYNDGNSRVHIRNIQMTASTLDVTVVDERN